MNIVQRRSARPNKSAAKVRRYDALSLDLGKFVSKFAACNNTSYVGTYMRSKESAMNPARCAGSYQDPDAFRHDYCLYNLVRKVAVSGSTESHDNAIVKFKATDAALERVREQIYASKTDQTDPITSHILWLAERKILRLLGDVPDLQDIFNRSSFSHGASALHPRVEGEAAFKYSYEYPEVTPAALPLARAVISRTPLWCNTIKGFTLCRGNRITTVPKDRTIDRPIACEPTLNMYLQKAIGDYFRTVLKQRGVDLNDQTINQKLAHEGSVTGRLATVDLSAASDSISLEICRELLPQAWFDLLLTVRSDEGILPDGTRITYQKMSSMGNGFTFELESMLFWALAQACEDLVPDVDGSRGTHRCSVYGDDIICRVETVPLLKRVFSVCGFLLNDDKSFWEGPFRESCGKHYFHGIDVTPVFVRREATGPEDIILTANMLKRWAAVNRMWDPRYKRVYDYLVSRLPPELRDPRIPDGYGDGALFGYLDEVLPQFKYSKKAGTHVYRAQVLTRARCKCHPSHNQYEALDAIYNGTGGLLVKLNSSQKNEAYDRDYVYVNKYNEVVPRPCAEDIVPLPGHYRTRFSSLVIYEWLD
jgi:hypothetical protein